MYCACFGNAGRGSARNCGSLIAADGSQKQNYCVLYVYVSEKSLLYGCETWSLTLREERKLRVFENVVLRRIFGRRRDKVTGDWRRLHNEELNDLYCLPNIVRVIKSR